MNARQTAAILFFIIAIAVPATAAETDKIAARIDHFLKERFEERSIQPAERAADAEFFRRVMLDLIGRPPKIEETEAFFLDTEPNKRSLLIDRLLADPKHADHFATTWRSLLIPEADSEPQIQYFVPGFEAWLREKNSSGDGFDQLVREIVAAPIAAADDNSPQMVLKDLKSPNPLAFIASKQADPGSIAASTVRLFMGLRLECAQCHDHPYGSWSQDQFWNQAAFFAGIERRGNSVFSPLVEVRDRGSIAVPDSVRLVSTQFLDGSKPRENHASPNRTQLADWITSPDNPWFAKAIVNRIWASLMGRGIVDPVDDFGTNSPPSHPELLDELAIAFVESGYDSDFIEAAICKSEAYQRTSQTLPGLAGEPSDFASMTIKPMSGEQFFATISQALNYQSDQRGTGVQRDQDRLKRQILSQFSSSGLYSNPETSVSQSLTLMNGDFVNRAVIEVAEQLVETSNLTLTRKIELLYLGCLARYPTESELASCVDYVSGGNEDLLLTRVSDVLWAVCNSAEFRFNH